MKHKILLFIFFILFGHLSLCYSLEKGTHSAINQHIAEHTVSGFSLDAYLKATLGFSKGKDEPINGQKVFEWLKLGGKKEDEPIYTRSLNHFHDPLKTWDVAGLKGTSKSSILWAQDQGLAGFLTGGNFAWKNVREYFYTALTGKDFSGTVIAYTQAEREIYFGATFRGLGQLMHLVEDASVPAHTRNDAHVIGYHYELAVDKFRTSNDPQEKIIFDNAIANPITFDTSIYSLPPNPLAPIPIAKIFDTDSYNDTNPNPNVTVGNTIGLSEYTNANFVSEGLISANFQDFPYPRIQDTTIIGKSYTSPSGTYTRQYYLKNCCGETNAGQGYLLSTVDLLDYWRQKYPILSVGLPKIPVLDDNVYKDYASLLIPRAVGYSAGLLDYFFRGTLEITAPDSYVYSIADGSKNPQQFTHIKAKVRNTTPKEKDANGNPLTYEDMQAGIIHAVARYKVIPNYAPDLSNYPPDRNVMKGIPYSYSVSVPITINSLSSTMPAEFTFDFTGNPIPAGITDLYLQVAFKGTLGNETDIAVAAGMKDLMEPTHHVFWNGTDMFSLYGHLYTAQQIRDDPNLLSLAAGANIDPHDISFEFSYMGESQPASLPGIPATVTLSAGRHIRLLVLTDRQDNNNVRIAWLSDSYPDGKHADVPFQGAQYEEVDGLWHYTPVTPYRTVNGHLNEVVLVCKPALGYCPYPQEEAIIPPDLAPYQATISFP